MRRTVPVKVQGGRLGRVKNEWDPFGFFVGKLLDR